MNPGPCNPVVLGRHRNISIEEGALLSRGLREWCLQPTELWRNLEKKEPNAQRPRLNKASSGRAAVRAWERSCGGLVGGFQGAVPGPGGDSEGALCSLGARAGTHSNESVGCTPASKDAQFPLWRPRSRGSEQGAQGVSEGLGFDCHLHEPLTGSLEGWEMGGVPGEPATFSGPCDTIFPVLSTALLSAGRFRRCEVGTCDMVFTLGKVDAGNTQVHRPARE